MSTPTVTPVKISQVDLLREWLKAGKTKGQHVNYFVFSRFAAEYMTYIEQGRNIPAGFGKHRASRYRTAVTTWLRTAPATLSKPSSWASVPTTHYAHEHRIRGMAES